MDEQISPTTWDICRDPKDLILDRNFTILSCFSLFDFPKLNCKYNVIGMASVQNTYLFYFFLTKRNLSLLLSRKYNISTLKAFVLPHLPKNFYQSRSGQLCFWITDRTDKSRNVKADHSPSRGVSEVTAKSCRWMPALLAMAAVKPRVSVTCHRSNAAWQTTSKCYWYTRAFWGLPCLWGSVDIGWAQLLLDGLYIHLGSSV